MHTPFVRRATHPTTLCRHCHLPRAPHGHGQAGGTPQPGIRGNGCHPHRRRCWRAGPAAAAQQVGTAACLRGYLCPRCLLVCTCKGARPAGARAPAALPANAAPTLLPLPAAGCAAVPTPATVSCPTARSTRMRATASTWAPPPPSGEGCLSPLPPRPPVTCLRACLCIHGATMLRMH